MAPFNLGRSVSTHSPNHGRLREGGWRRSLWNNTKVVPIQFHRNEWTVIIHSSATVIQFSIQQFFKRTYALNKWAPLPMGNISGWESKVEGVGRGLDGPPPEMFMG